MNDRTALADPDRLALLHDLNPEAEAGFDRITRFAIRLLNVPVSLVLIGTKDRQCFVGLDEPWETPLSHSFCQLAVISEAPLIVTDARSDDNAAIRDLGIVSCVGMPLTTSQGHTLGSFWVMDTRPRAWSADEIALAEELAHLVITEIELRGEIRARRAVEDQLTALVDDLENFAHIVAHDLKNPIASIIGFASLVEASRNLDDYDRDNINLIIQAGHRLSRMVDEMLLLAFVQHAGDLPLEIVDMSHIFREMELRFASLIKKHNAVLVVPDMLPAVRSYAPWIEEVWANYISNAIKYGGESPTITIGAEELDGCIRYWVKDDGEGLTREQQDKLFTAFSRVSEPKANGNGPGLSIIQRIVQKLGGTAGVDSTPGQGCRFWFILPLNPA